MTKWQPLLSPTTIACPTMVVTAVSSSTYKNRSPAKKIRSLKRLVSFLIKKMSQSRLPSPSSLCPQDQSSFPAKNPRRNLSTCHVNAISISPESPLPTQHSLSSALEKEPLTANDLMSYLKKSQAVSNQEQLEREQVREQEREKDLNKFRRMLGLPP